MTTTESTTIPAETVGTDAEVKIDPAVLSAIASHIAQELTGMRRIGLNFVNITGTSMGSDITFNMTRRRFEGDDCAIRVVYTVTSATNIPPAELPEDISPHTEALLDLWAQGSSQPESAA